VHRDRKIEYFFGRRRKVGIFFYSEREREGDGVGCESTACKREENSDMGRSIPVLALPHVGHPKDPSLSQAPSLR
jgi:hypothetical protein